MVPAFVNGQGPFPFALDTGASRTVISTGLSRRLGLDLVQAPPMTAGGGSGRVSATVGWVESLRVGDNAVGRLEVMAAEFMTSLSEALGTPLEGIIGYNFLRQFTVTIDYPGARLRLDET